MGLSSVRSPSGEFKQTAPETPIAPGEVPKESWCGQNKQFFPLAPGFRHFSDWWRLDSRFCPDWWCGIFSMKVCPAFPLDSEQLFADQEKDSQTFGSKQWWWPRDKDFCHIYRLYIEAFLCRNKHHSKKKHQKLRPPLFPGLRLLKLVNFGAFSCQIRTRLSFLQPAA